MKRIKLAGLAIAAPALSFSENATRQGGFIIRCARQLSWLGVFSVAMASTPALAQFHVDDDVANKATIKIGSTHVPLAFTDDGQFGIADADFTFFMWVRPTENESTGSRYIFRANDAFDVEWNFGTEKVCFRLHDSASNPVDIEIDLALQDTGELPVSDWVLLAATWEAAEDKLTAWAQSENIGRETGSVDESGWTPKDAIGLTVGDDVAVGSLALEGQYGLIVVRDHLIDGTDFDTVWASGSPNYFNPALKALGTSAIGREGVQWMMCHSLPASDTFPALIGSAATASDIRVYNRSDGCVGCDRPDVCEPEGTEPAQYDDDFIAIGTIFSVTGSAFDYISPYEDFESSGHAGFFQRRAYVNAGLDDDGTDGVAPDLDDLGNNVKPNPALRVISTDASWSQRTNDAEQKEYPHNMAHGFIQARLAETVGVFNRPCRLVADERWFGFDHTLAPYQSGSNLETIGDTGKEDYAHIWTGGERRYKGPGEGVYIGKSSTYATKATVEIGSGFTNVTATFRYYLLKGPGMSDAVTWTAKEASAQNVEGDDFDRSITGTLDLDTTTICDVIDAISNDRTLTFDGEVNVSIDHACFVCDGDAEGGWAVVTDVDYDSSADETTISFDPDDLGLWFNDPPAVGDTVKFGPWSIKTLEKDLPAMADAENFRGIQFTTNANGPAVLFACDAWIPNKAGWLFGTAGQGGTGYDRQVSKTQDKPGCGGRVWPWIEALDVDIALILPSPGQGSLDATMNDIAGEFKKCGSTEVAWVSMPAALFQDECGVFVNDRLDGVNRFMEDNCCGTGNGSNVDIWVSIVEDLKIGIPEDLAVDGLREDEVHISARGAEKFAKRLLVKIKEHATTSTASQFLDPCSRDVDGNGVIGVEDLQILLAQWGMTARGAPDFDGDNLVGTGDLLLLIEAWGDCQ